MTDTLKILGQLVPSANVLTDLYVVPAATSSSISSITICNQSASSINFSISVAAAGSADNPKQYIYYLIFLDAYDTFTATLGISLGTTDVVRILSNGASVSFNIFGVELT